MNKKIKFGTDGYRGIIDKDFNFDTVSLITKGIIKYLEKGTVIIGFDPRKDASKYAKFSAEIFKKYGFCVILSDKVVPTPIVAFCAKHVENSCGALMFTASHNPKEYLGIKFIPNYGGPATSEITNEIENLIEDESIELVEAEGKIFERDISREYLSAIQNLIDFETIKKNPPKIIFDALYGASIGYFDKILKDNGIEFETYNNKFDVEFGGGLPEPKKEFLHHSKIGYITVSNDGDADRYGVLDENGNWVSPNIILAILLKYLKEKGSKGVFVKTVGVSEFPSVVADKLNIKTIETPVGFKWIGKAMRENETILGGEDSGGLSIGEHISEKDGIFANLLIIEALAKTNKTLVELEDEIINFAGVEFFQDRVDIRLNSDDKKEEIINRIKNEDKFFQQKIVKKTEIDGIKLYLDDNYTKILVRKSGTEPLLRFYIESNSKSKVESVKEYIKGYIYGMSSNA